MLLFYNIKILLSLLFFKAFFVRYKTANSFFFVCFFIAFGFFILFFISGLVVALLRCLSYVFSNFLSLFFLLIKNWFLKNFFYLLIDLVFFFHKIRFSFFSGVSYYDPLLKIFSQNSAILKGELIMDFYNFSNKFIFEDSFNLPTSIFSTLSIFEPSRNFYFSMALQQSFLQILETQNKIRTFFFYSKKMGLQNNEKFLKPSRNPLRFDFFLGIKKRMILSFLAFLNLCSIDFFLLINSFQLLLIRNSSSFLKIMILKYFSFLKSCFLLVLINLENDSFLNYIYVTLYRLSSLGYVDKAEWKNLFNTYDLPIFSFFSYSGFSKHDFFFLLRVTFAYFFIYLNYLLFCLFSFLFFFIKFLYYFFYSFFLNKFLVISYQQISYNFSLLFVYFFFYRFFKFFKYYKRRFNIPEFEPCFYFPEFDFFYVYFSIIIHRFFLYFVCCLRVCLTALVFLSFKVKRYFPFYFLSKIKNTSFNFFINYFISDKQFEDPRKIYSIFSKLYHFSLKSYVKQVEKISIWSRFFFRYKCFFLFLRLKIFSFLKYDVSCCNSFSFYKVISFVRFLFLNIFAFIFLFRSNRFQTLLKLENFETLSISIEDFEESSLKKNFNSYKAIFLINFFVELCLSFLFLLLRTFFKIFNIPNFFFFIRIFYKFFYFLVLLIFYFFWVLYVFFFFFLFYFGFLFVIFLHFFIFSCTIYLLLTKLFFFIFFGFFVIFFYFFFRVLFFLYDTMGSSRICLYLYILMRIFFSFFNLYFKLFRFLKSRNIGFLQIMSIFFLIRNDLMKYEFVHSRFDYLIQNSLNLEFVLNNFLKKSFNSKTEFNFLTKFFGFENVKPIFLKNYNLLDKYKQTNSRDKFIQLQIKNDLFPEFEYHKYLRLRNYKNSSLFRLRKNIEPIDMYFDFTLDPLKNFNVTQDSPRAELTVDVLKFFYQDDYLFLKNLLFFRSVFSRKNLSFFYDDLDTMSNFRVKYTKISPLFRYFYLKREKLKYLFSLYSFGNINYFSFSILMNWLSYYKILRNVFDFFSLSNNSFLVFGRRSFSHWNLVFFALIFDCLLFFFDAFFQLFLFAAFFFFISYFCSYFYIWLSLLLLLFFFFQPFFLVFFPKIVYFYILRITRKPFLINFFFFLNAPSYYLQIFKFKALASKFGFFVRFVFNFFFFLLMSCSLFGITFIFALLNFNFYVSFDDNILFFYFLNDLSFSCFPVLANVMVCYLFFFYIIYLILKFFLFRFLKKFYFGVDYLLFKYFVLIFSKLNNSFFSLLMSKFLISPFCLLKELDFILRSKKKENFFIKKNFLKD